MSHFQDMPPPDLAITTQEAKSAQVPRKNKKTFVSVDGQDSHGRPKVTRACGGCRRRKIKCDAATTKTWPCSACVRLKLNCIPPTISYEKDSGSGTFVFDLERSQSYNGGSAGSIPGQEDIGDLQLPLPLPQTSQNVRTTSVQNAHQTAGKVVTVEETADVQQPPGLIARLYEACLSYLHYLALHGLNLEDKVHQAGNAKALERVYHTLRLWGDGFAAADGTLDEKLEKSARIRSEVLSLLRSIGTTLTTCMPSRVSARDHTNSHSSCSTRFKSYRR